ncbi:MAG: TIGR02594 family protein [Actinobacteria bacterium]|nr:TIGR02594 family protein [Actinomycetota bacterium]
MRGTRHNPKILEYHAITTLRAHQDETAWCSSFVNWCITQADLRGTDRANARSWLSWGVPLSQPKQGAVAVFWRGKSNDGVPGHVGFYLEDSGSAVKLLGGNQGDRVSIKDQTMKKFLGFPISEIEEVGPWWRQVQMDNPIRHH